MPEVSLTVLIIAAAAALIIGFVIAYLFQGGKISAAIAKEQQKREELIFDISEKEKALAVKETELLAEHQRRTEAENRNIELLMKNGELTEELQKISAKALRSPQTFL